MFKGLRGILKGLYIYIFIYLMFFKVLDDFCRFYIDVFCFKVLEEFQVFFAGFQSQGCGRAAGTSLVKVPSMALNSPRPSGPEGLRTCCLGPSDYRRFKCMNMFHYVSLFTRRKRYWNIEQVTKNFQQRVNAFGK